MKKTIIAIALLSSITAYAQTNTSTSGSIVADYNLRMQAAADRKAQLIAISQAAAQQKPTITFISGSCDSTCLGANTSALAYIPPPAPTFGGSGWSAGPTTTTVATAPVPDTASTQTTTKYRQVLYSCDQFNAYVGGRLKNPGNPAGGKQYNVEGLVAISDNGWYAVKLAISYGMQGPTQWGYGGAVMRITDTVDSITGDVIRTVINPVSVGFCENSYNNWVF